MTPLQAKVNKLSQSNPVPGEAKHRENQERLMRMAGFYKLKAPQSKDGGALFNGFVVSLEYAVNVIGMYRVLTIMLAELAEKEDS